MPIARRQLAIMSNGGNNSEKKVIYPNFALDFSWIFGILLEAVFVHLSRAGGGCRLFLTSHPSFPEIISTSVIPIPVALQRQLFIRVIITAIHIHVKSYGTFTGSLPTGA